jgi:N-acetylneuraminate lyase
MTTFRGVWPALVTPFTSEDTVNVTVLRDLVEYHLDKQVNGFYVCGRTGQGLAMSVAERQLVAETVMEQVRARVPVIIHIGCMAIQDTLTLAHHARQIGAAGISSIIPPFYDDMRQLYAYFRMVAETVPDLPFFPYLFGPTNAVALMRQLLQIPNVAGTKYTGPNMFEFRQIVEFRHDNWYIFSGMDEQCLFAAMAGAAGNIGSTLNFMPGVYRQIHECVANADLAQALTLQNKVNKLTEILIAHGFMGALAEAMRLLGFDCGRVRLPHFPVVDEKRKTLHTELKSVGFKQLTQM